MTMRWQEVVVLLEGEEDVVCDHCGFPARRVEGRLVHREEPAGRFTVRWRPGRVDHPAQHVLYLGDWTRRGGMQDGPAVAVADYRGGEGYGFYLRDDAEVLLRALKPWRPRFVRRADAIGKPLGETIFALLDAIHVKDSRLAEIRGWDAPQGRGGG